MLDSIDNIAGQLREAACDPAAWPTALDSLNAFVGGSGIVLLSVDERLRHAPSSTDLTEMIDDYFSNGWYARDRREPCRPALEHVGIALDHEWLGADEIEAFYREFLAPHGRKWFAGVSANLAGDLWCLALQRSPAKGPFERADMPRLEAVRGLLEDAALQARYVGAQWLDGALSAFDSDGSAALVLDRTGRILHMSAAAHAILVAARTERPGRSRLSDIRTVRALEQALRSMLPVGGRTRLADEGASLDIGGAAYRIETTSLFGKAGLIFSNASLLVRLHRRGVDPAEILRARYGLTGTQVRVALALAAGLDIRQIADTFAITPNTIRAHLKAAYAKTETGSQAKLTALIARLGHRL